MKIIHFSDVHAGGKAEDWMAYFDKRWVGVFNYRFRRQFQHDLSYLQLAVEFILKEKPDVAVFTGDLTSAGQPGEFARTVELLEPLRQAAIPLLLLPGNHDYYVKRPNCVKAMKETINYLSNGLVDFDAMPLKIHINGIDFFLINESWPSNLLCSWGFLKRDSSDFMLKECSKEKKYPRILLGHYPLLDEHPISRIRHRLFGQQRVLNLLKTKALDISLCGHVHWPSAKLDETGRGEICAGSITKNNCLSLLNYIPDNDVFTQECHYLEQSV
jgi:3',5'-cyclic AMP phosphodiesterase CpdA